MSTVTLTFLSETQPGARLLSPAGLGSGTERRRQTSGVSPPDSLAGGSLLPGEGEDGPGNRVTSTPRPGLSESHPDLPLLLLAGSGKPDKQAVCLWMCPDTGVIQPGPLWRERGEALEGRQPLCGLCSTNPG